MNFSALPRPTKAYHTKPYAAISPSRPELSLTGKTVLITGGATGIGLQTTLAFAEAGASTIALVSRRAEPLNAAKLEVEKRFPNTKVLVFPASVSDRDAVQKVVQEIGVADVLVLNAAWLPKPTSLLESDASDSTAMFEINVLGPIYLIQAFLALPLRSEGRERTVIYVTSAGVQMPLPGTGVYNASKAAMTYLMQILHAETQGKGVRAFAYHPAIAFTPLSQDTFGLKGDEFEFDDPKLPAQYAVWLASPEADFLKGRYTWAHWDVEELKAKKDKIEALPQSLTLGLVQDNSLIA